MIIGFGAQKMKLKHIAAAIVAVMVLGGCATVENNYVPQTQQISFPALNDRQIVTLGEAMLSQGTSTTTAGIFLPQENNIHGYLLSSGFYPQSGQDDEYVYTNFEMRRSSSTLGSVIPGGLTGGIYPIGLRFSRKSQESCAIVPGLYGITSATCDTEYPYRFTEQPMVSENNFQQTLIYSGRVGDRVKISYREFSGNVARPAFSNEAEYDLSSSDTIAYRGARIRVINANNESIEYEVISNFNVSN